MITMRQHKVMSAMFLELEDDYDTIGMISKTSKTSMPSGTAVTESHEDSMVWKVGYGAVKLGTFILSVPDPIPMVDESVGIGLVAGGAALMYSQER